MVMEPEAPADAGSHFADFVQGRGAALQRTAFLLTGDWELAEDLLQTALAKAYLAWGRIEHKDPEGYVRAVLANTHATWWRRKWRGEAPTSVVPDQAHHEVWSGVDDRLEVAAALRRLPPRQRAVIVLRFHEDMTEPAVAHALGCSVGTVKSQTAKALAKLRADPTLRPVDEG